MVPFLYEYTLVNFTESPQGKMLPTLYILLYTFSFIYSSPTQFSSEIFKFGYPVSVRAKF